MSKRAIKKSETAGSRKAKAEAVRKLRHNPPTGWSEDRHTGEVACPHRDLSVCGGCAADTPEAVEVYGQHFWIADPTDRAALAAETQEVLA